MSKIIGFILVQGTLSKLLTKGSCFGCLGSGRPSKADQINEAIKTCQQDQGTKALDLIMEAGYPDLSKKDAANQRTVLHNAVVAKVPLVVVQGLINRVKELEKSVSEYVNIRDNKGETALQLGEKNHRSRSFAEMVGSCHKEIRYAIAGCPDFPTCSRAVVLIKNADYSVLSHTEIEGTVLHNAVWCSVDRPASLNVVKAILDRVTELGKPMFEFLDISAEAIHQPAFISAVAFSRNPEVVKQLIGAVADVNYYDEVLSVALGGSISEEDQVQREIVNILLTAKADVTFKDLEVSFWPHLDFLARSAVIEAGKDKLNDFLESTYTLGSGENNRSVLKNKVSLAHWVTLPEFDAFIQIVAEKIDDALKNPGSDPNLFAFEPIIASIDHNHFKIMNLLLEKIPNYLQMVNMKNTNRNPLDYACERLNFIVTVGTKRPSDGLIKLISSMMALEKKQRPKCSSLISGR
jgi:hypothetical protein